MEQHDATRGRQVGDLDGLHHERLRVPDGRPPVHIHGEQFGAVGPPGQPDRTRVVPPPAVQVVTDAKIVTRVRYSFTYFRRTNENSLIIRIYIYIIINYTYL